MNLRISIILIISILMPFFSYAEDINTDETIEQFDKKWAINAAGLYSNIFFIENSGNYTAESPWAISVGLNYKGTSMSIAIPVLLNYDKRLLETFNIQLTSYNDLMYYEAFCKRYRGFGKVDLREYSGIELTERTDRENINLDIIFTGLSAGWLLNGKKHSLSAAYELDRKQLVSSGSLILGFGIFYLSIKSDESKLERHNLDQSILYFGPTAGYSYTFVFPEGMFLNINAVAGFNAGIDTDTGKWLLIPQIIPKMAFGHHFNTWSWSITGSNIIAFVLWSKDAIDTLMPTTIALNISKRF